MANDLADGQTPELTKRFYQSILDLRKTPALTEELFKRVPEVYSAILPGFSPHAAPVPGGTYVVIGSSQQMELYQSYLQTAVGPETKLYRIYPRDFWMVADF
jgi:hypothetical protein